MLSASGILKRIEGESWKSGARHSPRQAGRSSAMLLSQGAVRPPLLSSAFCEIHSHLPWESSL